MADSPHPSTTPLVLYVDDERANRIVFEQNFKAEFRIKSVPDARTALELLEHEEVAVLVSDIRMPEIDGLQLIRMVRDKYPSTLRMVITAFSDVDPILTAINEGLVARYIIKPFDPMELAQALRWATELWSFGKDSAELLRRILQTERLATLGGLAALFVHDLRTPVMIVSQIMEELRALADAVPVLRQAIDQSPIDERVKAGLLSRLETTPEVLADAKQSSVLVAGIVDALYDFVKARKPTAEKLVDPVPVIKHTLSMYQKLTIYAGASIGYRGPEHLPNVRMTPIALAQVMLNLVGNAAQAVIARKEPNKIVAVEARASGDMLEVLIRDEGVGMSPETLKRIGTPYFTTRQEGTGLGIANCHRLIGSAGGRIKIESEEGVGTVVTLLLPIAA